eukprot:scaffold5531_cov126-Isochrysis_galbana.AAC.3
MLPCCGRSGFPLPWQETVRALAPESACATASAGDKRADSHVRTAVPEALSSGRRRSLSSVCRLAPALARSFSVLR